MTLTQRQMVDNDRSRFDFKDDLIYLTETKRGLTRETVEEITGMAELGVVLLMFTIGREISNCPDGVGAVS